MAYFQVRTVSFREGSWHQTTSMMAQDFRYVTPAQRSVLRFKVSYQTNSLYIHYRENINPIRILNQCPFLLRKTQTSSTIKNGSLKLISKVFLNSKLIHNGIQWDSTYSRTNCSVATTNLRVFLVSNQTSKRFARSGGKSKSSIRPWTQRSWNGRMPSTNLSVKLGIFGKAKCEAYLTNHWLIQRLPKLHPVA